MEESINSNKSFDELLNELYLKHLNENKTETTVIVSNEDLKSLFNEIDNQKDDDEDELSEVGFRCVIDDPVDKKTKYFIVNKGRKKHKGTIFVSKLINNCRVPIKNQFYQSLLIKEIISTFPDCKRKYNRKDYKKGSVFYNEYNKEYYNEYNEHIKTEFKEFDEYVEKAEQEKKIPKSKSKDELICTVEKLHPDNRPEMGDLVCYTLFHEHDILMRTIIPKEREDEIKVGTIISFNKKNSVCKQRESDLFPVLFLNDFKIINKETKEIKGE